jgi:hypothetical protein
MPSDDNPGMGFNPFREHRRSPVDLVLLAAALLIVVVLVLWAAGVF